MSESKLEIGIKLTNLDATTFKELDKLVGEAISKGADSGLKDALKQITSASVGAREKMRANKPDTVEGAMARAERRQLHTLRDRVSKEILTGGPTGRRERDTRASDALAAAGLGPEAAKLKKQQAGFLNSAGNSVDVDTVKAAIKENVKYDKTKVAAANKERAVQTAFVTRADKEELAKKRKERAVQTAHVQRVSKLEAEEAKKNRVSQRMDRKIEQSESIKDMMMLNSTVSALTAGMPGAGLLQSGVYGFTSGYSRASWTKDPKTGEMVKAGGEAAMAGGLQGAAVSLGLAAVAQGMISGAMGSRSEEREQFAFSRAMGGKTGVGKGWQKYTYQHLPANMTMEEGMPASLAMLEATRGEGGVKTALNVQNQTGRGSDFAGLAGTMTRGGAFAQAKDVDPALAKAWTAIFATGVELGFKNGDVAELIAGANASMNKQILGTKLSQDAVQQAMAMSSFLGGNDAFKGAKGFQMMDVVNQAMTGQGSAYGKAISLQAAGLGKDKDWVESNIQMEKGLFGEGGIDEFKTWAEEFKKTTATGVNSTSTQSLQMALGGSYSGAKGINELINNPEAMAKLTKGDMSATLNAAQPLEVQAQKAMISLGNWTTLDKSLSDISRNLGTVVQKLIPPVESIASSLAWLTGGTGSELRDATEDDFQKSKKSGKAPHYYNPFTDESTTGGTVKALAKEVASKVPILNLVIKSDMGKIVAEANVKDNDSAKTIDVPLP